MLSGRLRLLSSFFGRLPVVRKDVPQFTLTKNIHMGSALNQDWDGPTEPEIPVYDALNIQMKGYDYAVLEKYAKYVHNTADRIGLEVEDSWATPARNFRVTQLKPESSVVQNEYRLNLYERNVQIVEVPSTLLPVFVNVIEASTPAGVTVRVHPHLPEHSEIRYVPDIELKELKQQLQDLRGEKKS